MPPPVVPARLSPQLRGRPWSAQLMCESHTNLAPRPVRAQPAVPGAGRLRDPLPAGDAPLAAYGHPERVLRRVHGGARRDRMGGRPVELVQGDAVERDTHVVPGLLQLAGGLGQVDAVVLAVSLSTVSHRPCPSRSGAAIQLRCKPPTPLAPPHSPGLPAPQPALVRLPFWPASPTTMRSSLVPHEDV